LVWILPGSFVIPYFGFSLDFDHILSLSRLRLSGTFSRQKEFI